MPSKKGKKGKGRKKALTEEEKTKQAEMKALAEKEKLVRRRRLTNAFLKLKKDKEYELLKVNDNKLMDMWRPKLRKLKCDELIDDYKMLQAAFERNNRKKDELIEDLQSRMDQNEEEYNNAFDMHLHNIDQLLEFYRKRLTQVRDMYGEQKKKLLKILNDEKSRMDDYQEKSLRYLNGVIAAVNMRYKGLASDAKAELFIRQEEMRNKAMEETHATKIATDESMRAVWDDIQTLLVDYDTKIAPLRNEFLELRKKDDVVVGIIDALFKKMFKLQVGIESLTEKDKNYCATLQHLLSDLNAKRDGLKAKYKLEQQRFNSVFKHGNDNIRNLALISGALLENMDGMLSQRERLMKCVERCRKQERFDEKVDPFMHRWGLKEVSDGVAVKSAEGDALTEPESVYTIAPIHTEAGDEFNFTPRKMEHTMGCDCNPCTCEAGQDIVITDEPLYETMKTLQDFSLLERFWTRFNRASLELRILRQKRVAMVDDNQQLKLALRNYMGGLNPSEICL